MRMSSVLWSDKQESPSTLVSITGSSVPLGSTASTLIWEQDENPWWREIVQRLVGEAIRYPVSKPTLISTLSWLGQLPGGMPQPHVGAGDDGTVSVEWDRRGNHLHVMFEDTSGEVFFQSSNGDEWETPLDAGHDKIRAAIRQIARA
jgi:hypothetical protein